MTHFSGNTDVLDNIVFIVGPKPAPITALTYDSRKVEKDGCFVCIDGHQSDGHLFIESAIHNGAHVIIGSKKNILMDWYYKRPDLTFVLVRDTKKALARYATTFYQNVHEKMSLIGVTGTNGKTTITAYIRSLLNALGNPTGSIGTAGVWDQQQKLEFNKSTPTTPESSDLHSIFSHLYEKKASHVVMEATSIALDQERLHGIQFDLAVHSNLWPEHLDFHHTMEDYKKAKLRLFQHADIAVVNNDDDGMAPDIIRMFEGELWTYGMERDADVRARNMKSVAAGTSFDLLVDGKVHSVIVPIFGNHNVANFLAAVTTCLAQGHGIENILRVLPLIQGPPGRFQVVNNYPDRQLVLDFAHSPRALETLFETIEPFSYNRIILLITGIGIRERHLRPEIAQAVEGKADAYVVTVDHPGDEDPEIVMADVVSGFTEVPANLHLEAKRGQAIQKAMSLAEKRRFDSHHRHLHGNVPNCKRRTGSLP